MQGRSDFFFVWDDGLFFFEMIRLGVQGVVLFVYLCLFLFVCSSSLLFNFVLFFFFLYIIFV